MKDVSLPGGGGDPAPGVGSEGAHPSDADAEEALETSPHVLVGRIGRPHGVKGEVTVLSDSDDPDRFTAGALLGTSDGRRLVIESARPFRDAGFLVRFAGVEGRDAAEALRGTVLTVPAAQRRRLEAGQWWLEELVGLAAVDAEGKALGTITDVDIGPQDRLVVTTADGREVLVPFVADLVDDPEGGRIVIRAPEGLFEP